MPHFPKVAFIGFGESGQAIASGWREAGVATIAAWDTAILGAISAAAPDRH
jgi:3-hydroxyisobutyrate dehydrogenase-like beta-hydroxyacid dehydrogenase